MNIAHCRKSHCSFFVALFSAVVLSPLSLLAQAQDVESKPTAKRVISKATTLKAPELLKAPPGIDKGFTVAKAVPQVDVCFFAGLKDRGKGTLWSSWGDGCLASNGKYYTSVGDHLGIDGYSYVYEYDPMTKELRRVVDVARVVGLEGGAYGHGKIHAGIHEAADGWLYFTTYWGKHREIEAAFKEGYQGSLLLRFNPKSGQTQNLGAILPEKGLPASYFDAQRQLLYFHSVYEGDIVAFDVKAGKVKFTGGADRNTNPYRTFLGAADGRVYFSGKDGFLHYYDPAKNALAATKAKLPSGTGRKGDNLRAASRPDAQGILYGMTANGLLFSFDPKTEAVKELGGNLGAGEYTAVMALSPDEKYLYYAPGAHGSGGKLGIPIVQYEISTGKRKVLAFLGQTLRERLKYNLGGTYNLQLDPAGERLFFTFNGAPYVPDAKRAEHSGQPSVIVMHIPASER